MILLQTKDLETLQMTEGNLEIWYPRKLVWRKKKSHQQIFVGGLDYALRAEKRPDSKAWREARWQRDWVFSSGHRGVQEGHLCPWEANWQVPAVMGRSRALWACSVRRPDMLAQRASPAYPAAAARLLITLPFTLKGVSVGAKMDRARHS